MKKAIVVSLVEVFKAFPVAPGEPPLPDGTEFVALSHLIGIASSVSFTPVLDVRVRLPPSAPEPKLIALFNCLARIRARPVTTKSQVWGLPRIYSAFF